MPITRGGGDSIVVARPPAGLRSPSGKAFFRGGGGASLHARRSSPSCRLAIALAGCCLILVACVILVMQSVPSGRLEVPNHVHLIFGLQPNFGKVPFGLLQFLCVKSIHERIRPTAIYFHYKYMPEGLWWEQARPYLTLRQVEPPTEIYGNKLERVAHQADVIRLQILLEEGGIYLDMDVIATRSFDPIRKTGRGFVMGKEGVDGSIGLCNAVLLSTPNSRFALRWMDRYRSFRGGAHGSNEWNYHSVQLPRILAHDYPDEITQLNQHSFFWPHWDAESLAYLFAETNDGVDEFAQNYAVHMWSHNSFGPYVSGLTIEHIRSVDTRFNLLVRDLVADLNISSVDEMVDSFPTFCSTIVVCSDETNAEHAQASIRSIQHQRMRVPHQAVLVDASARGQCSQAYEHHQRRHANDVEVLVIKAPPRTPGWKARNMGVHASQGKWVSVLRAGDVLDENYLEAARTHGSRHPRATLLYPREHVDGEHKHQQHQQDGVAMDRAASFPRSALVRRSALMDVVDDRGGPAGMSALFRVDIPSSPSFSYEDIWHRMKRMGIARPHELPSGVVRTHHRHHEEETPAGASSSSGSSAARSVPHEHHRHRPVHHSHQAYAAHHLSQVLEHQLVVTMHPLEHEPAEVIQAHKAIGSLLLDKELAQAFWAVLRDNGKGSHLVHCWRGILLARQNRVDEAYQEYKSAVAHVDARDWQPFWLMLHTQLELGMYVEAKENKLEALRRCPALDREVSVRG